MIRPALILALGAFAVVVAGCASSPSPEAPAPAPAASEGGGAITAAIGLLYQGRAGEARAVLVKVLERHPDDQKAKSLLQQIDASPETLLGKENFPYRIRSEDTLSSLAERFLGDATLFYALARYNDLTLPVTLQPGTTLRIPGRPKPVAKPTPRLPRPTPPAAAAPRPPSSPAVGKQRAVQLRAAGLEQLNRGDIDKAVKLLQQALQIDPTNAVIKRDLERAKRISRTVRARP